MLCRAWHGARPEGEGGAGRPARLRYPTGEDGAHGHDHGHGHGLGQNGAHGLSTNNKFWIWGFGQNNKKVLRERKLFVSIKMCGVSHF